MAANNTHKHNKNFPNSVLNKIISTAILKNSTPTAKCFNPNKVFAGDPVNVVTGNVNQSENQ